MDAERSVSAVSLDMSYSQIDLMLVSPQLETSEPQLFFSKDKLGDP